MKVRILGSAIRGSAIRGSAIRGSAIRDSGIGSSEDAQYLSSYLVNDCIAVDAGAIGINGSVSDQKAIRNVLITHSHIDHIATLPIFLEHAYERGCPPVSVHGHPSVLQDLRQHVFNNVIWPDFVRLTSPELPFLQLCPLEPERPIRVAGVTVVPVLVNHIVTTYGYILTDGQSTVIFSGDSGPTERIWQLAHETPPSRAVFLEVCFPDSLGQLAHISRHLTPSSFAAEVAKMPEVGTVVATHIKARFRDKTIEELQRLAIPGLVIGESGVEYTV